MEEEPDGCLVPEHLFKLCLAGLSRFGYVVMARQADDADLPDQYRVVCECCGAVVLMADWQDGDLWNVDWFGKYKTLYNERIVKSN